MSEIEGYKLGKGPTSQSMHMRIQVLRYYVRGQESEVPPQEEGDEILQESDAWGAFSRSVGTTFNQLWTSAKTALNQYAVYEIKITLAENEPGTQSEEQIAKNGSRQLSHSVLMRFSSLQHLLSVLQKNYSSDNPMSEGHSMELWELFPERTYNLTRSVEDSFLKERVQTLNRFFMALSRRNDIIFTSRELWMAFEMDTRLAPELFKFDLDKHEQLKPRGRDEVPEEVDRDESLKSKLNTINPNASDLLPDVLVGVNKSTATISNTSRWGTIAREAFPCLQTDFDVGEMFWVFQYHDDPFDSIPWRDKNGLRYGEKKKRESPKRKPPTPALDPNTLAPILNDQGQPLDTDGNLYVDPNASSAAQQAAQDGASWAASSYAGGGVSGFAAGWTASNTVGSWWSQTFGTGEEAPPQRKPTAADCRQYRVDHFPYSSKFGVVDFYLDTESGRNLMCCALNDFSISTQAVNTIGGQLSVFAKSTAKMLEHLEDDGTGRTTSDHSGDQKYETYAEKLYRSVETKCLGSIVCLQPIGGGSFHFRPAFSVEFRANVMSVCFGRSLIIFAGLKDGYIGYLHLGRKWEDQPTPLMKITGDHEDLIVKKQEIVDEMYSLGQNPNDFRKQEEKNRLSSNESKRRRLSDENLDNFEKLAAIEDLLEEKDATKIYEQERLIPGHHHEYPVVAIAASGISDQAVRENDISGITLYSASTDGDLKVYSFRLRKKIQHLNIPSEVEKASRIIDSRGVLGAAVPNKGPQQILGDPNRVINTVASEAAHHQASKKQYYTSASEHATEMVITEDERLLLVGTSFGNVLVYAINVETRVSGLEFLNLEKQEKQSSSVEKQSSSVGTISSAAAANQAIFDKKIDVSVRALNLVGVMRCSDKIQPSTQEMLTGLPLKIKHLNVMQDKVVKDTSEIAAEESVPSNDKYLLKYNVFVTVLSGVFIWQIVRNLMPVKPNEPQLEHMSNSDKRCLAMTTNAENVMILPSQITVKSIMSALRNRSTTVNNGGTTDILSTRTLPGFTCSSVRENTRELLVGLTDGSFASYDLQSPPSRIPGADLVAKQLTHVPAHRSSVKALTQIGSGTKSFLLSGDRSGRVAIWDFS